MKRYEQLCWTCKRATGGCRWSIGLQPIEGWQAKEVTVKDSEGDFSSFVITGCPLYVREGKQGSVISIKELACLLGENYGNIRRKNNDFLTAVAKLHGYKISVIDGNHRKIFVERKN